MFLFFFFSLFLLPVVLNIFTISIRIYSHHIRTVFYCHIIRFTFLFFAFLFSIIYFLVQWYVVWVTAMMNVLMAATNEAGIQGPGSGGPQQAPTSGPRPDILGPRSSEKGRCQPALNARH